MYICHHGKAIWSQSPVKCLDFEAKRIAETKATHSLTWLGKFEQRMSELTTSRFILPEPRILHLRSSAHAAHRTPTAPLIFLVCAMSYPQFGYPYSSAPQVKGLLQRSDNGDGRGQSHHWKSFPT